MEISPIVTSGEDIQPDAVRQELMHFAALIEAGEEVAEVPEIYFRNNTAATFDPAGGDARHRTRPARLQFNRRRLRRTENFTPILEDAKLQPTNPYGESKLLVEQMLRWMNLSHGLKYASLRYFNVAGADDRGGYGEAHEPGHT